MGSASLSLTQNETIVNYSTIYEFNCLVFACQQQITNAGCLNSLLSESQHLCFSVGGLCVTDYESLVNRKPPRVVMMRMMT